MPSAFDVKIAVSLNFWPAVSTVALTPISWPALLINPTCDPCTFSVCASGLCDEADDDRSARLPWFEPDSPVSKGAEEVCRSGRANAGQMPRGDP